MSLVSQTGTSVGQPLGERHESRHRERPRRKSTNRSLGHSSFSVCIEELWSDYCIAARWVTMASSSAPKEAEPATPSEAKEDAPDTENVKRIEIKKVRTSVDAESGVGSL